MTMSEADLLKLLHETRAVNIWNAAAGPVFWYAANVPGPFYVHTEKLIGEAAAERMLREITAIVAGTADARARAGQLERLIMEAYKGNRQWQSVIAAMLARAQADFAADDVVMISGGERRDWLFSIPLAHAADLPHLYLYKNKMHYAAHTLQKGQSVLHVSDLINNAASFFDLWQPALDGLGLKCSGNLCVNLRGENGLRRLREARQKTVALATVDIEFFRRLHAADLIAQSVVDELAVFFASAQEWAGRYLIGRPELFDADGCDAKSFERLRFFIADDPWGLRPQHAAFFAEMQKAIERRLARAA